MGREPDAATATDFDPGRRFVRATDVLWRRSAGVVMVRTVARSEVLELSGTGVLLWLALGEPITAGELAEELAVLVGAPVSVVADDVLHALADLVQRGLVTEVDER